MSIRLHPEESPRPASTGEGDPAGAEKVRWEGVYQPWRIKDVPPRNIRDASAATGETTGSP